MKIVGINPVEVQEERTRVEKKIKRANSPNGCCLKLFKKLCGTALNKFKRQQASLKLNFVFFRQNEIKS